MIKYQKGKVNLYLGDCMDLMAGKPDNYWDLAIVDPPYGLGDKLAHAGNGKNAQSKFTDDFKSKNWDNEIPPPEYWEQLFRVSKNQIIWGGNYFLDYLSATRCFVAWDKMVFIPTMSRVELAWTSFDRLPKYVQINNNDSNRMHLTQKPVKLYEYLLNEFSEPNFKIIDTHGGSMSSAIAAYYYGCEFDCIELDKDYYNDAVKRFKEQTMSQRIEFKPNIQPEQAKLF